MTDEIRRQPLIAQLEALGPLRPGDVLVLRGFDDDTTPHEEVIEAVIAHYKRVFAAEGYTGDADLRMPLLIFPAPDQAIEHLDEDKMRAHGWVRA